MSALVAKLRALLMIPESEPLDFPFVDSDVARFQRLRRDPARHAIDETTWKDLLLGEWRRLLSPEVSIFGQHLLYQRLCDGVEGQEQPGRIRALMADPAALAALHGQCTSLRRADKEIATLLYEDVAPPVPWWAGKTWPLTLALLLTIAGAALSQLSWLGTAFVMYLLMAGQMRYYARAEEFARSVQSLQMLLRVDSLLQGPARSGKINRDLTRSQVVLLIPGARGYLDWFMLDNVNHYFKCVQLVHANLDYLRERFEHIANLEADIALARHLLKTPQFCWADAAGVDRMAFDGMVHPMLPEAQPLSMALNGKGAFISGQNGIGKSTLLRSVGLNLVAARAFGFCYATRASVPHVPVYASMQAEDNLFGGESLYMAELRRAKELLAAADGPHPGICVIDEIFRGTNHMESVSAAASVLDVLAARGLVIVSSHNLVLAPLLQHRLDPLCVAKGGDGALTLSPGVLAHTNGIALLAQRGFGAGIEGNAARVFDWLSGYLAHPADSAQVLGRRAIEPKAA